MRRKDNEKTDVVFHRWRWRSGSGDFLPMAEVDNVVFDQLGRSMSGEVIHDEGDLFGHQQSLFWGMFGEIIGIQRWLLGHCQKENGSGGGSRVQCGGGDSCLPEVGGLNGLVGCSYFGCFWWLGVDCFGELQLMV